MRILHRNTSPVWYANYDGLEMSTDKQGYYTGNQKVRYTNPVRIDANISPAKNVTHYALFGTDVSYDRTLTLCDTSSLITENSVLWINTQPVLNEDGSTDTPFDHTVEKIAKWKNSLVVAVEEVKVSG